MTKTFRLPNGITCISEGRAHSGKVSMHIRFRAGSADEAADENGLTYLMQEAINGGTNNGKVTRSRAQLAEDVESKGAVIDTIPGRTRTNFEAEALTRYAGEIFSVMADMVRYPAFEAAEIQKTKTQIAQGLEQGNESPAIDADKKFFEAAFSGQAAGEDPMGNQELLASFTPEQVKRKHAELLAHPEDMVVSFTGDIDDDAAKKLVEDYFGDLPAAATPAKKPQMEFTGGDVRAVADNGQLNLQLGFKAPAADDPDKYAAMMLNEFLSGGMSSPLFQEIREKRGLVYSIYTDYSTPNDTGLFRVVAGAGKGNAGELVSVTMDILGKVIRDGVSRKNIDRARKRIVRGYQSALETARDSNAMNAQQMLSSGRLMSPDEYEAHLKNVTSDDLRRVCATMLKDGKFALSAVGPQETMPAAQEIEAMMKAQGQGVTIPAARPLKASIKAPFARAAKKAQTTAVEEKMTVLKNGIRVVTMERPGNLATGVWTGAGSDNETPEQNGSSHALEHLPFKGTKSYKPGEIDRIVEGRLSGDLNAYTEKDHTAFFFYNLEKEALAEVIKIGGEMVFKATLDAAEFDGKQRQKPDGSVVKAKGERDVIIEELKRANDEPVTLLADLMMETAYPNQPHGRPIIGTEKTLRAMTIEQLREYRDEFYAPNNAVFAAAGPIKHEDFVMMVEKQYGHLPAQEFPPLPTPLYKGGTALAEHRNVAMCDVALVAEGVPSSHPDNLAYTALEMLLGSGASSRLNKKIVMDQEIAVEVVAGSDSYSNGGGIFYVGASLKPEKVKPFVKAVYEEMRALGKDLTQADLDKVKISMEMGLLSGLETNREALDSSATDVLAYGRLVKQPEISEMIQKLSLDDVRRVLKKVLASSPTLTMVVPPKTDPRYLLKHDEVIALRDGKEPPKTAAKPDSPKH